MCEVRKKRPWWNNNAETLSLLNEQDTSAQLVSTSVPSRKMESNASENNQEIGKKVAKILTILGRPLWKTYSSHLTHMNSSSVVSSRDLRKSENVRPAKLKIRSTIALLAGTPRYCLAMTATWGNFFWPISFHHFIMSTSPPSAFWPGNPLSGLSKPGKGSGECAGPSLGAQVSWSCLRDDRAFPSRWNPSGIQRRDF